MRILIVEDNSFNAYCLQRLLETASDAIKVSIVDNSLAALEHVSAERPDYVILDGDLGVSDGLYCNGPTLADAIWKIQPHSRIIAWTDSEVMRTAFAAVFKQHGKFFNGHCCWTKVVSQDRIRKTLAYFSGQFIKPQTIYSALAEYTHNEPLYLSDKH